MNFNIPVFFEFTPARLTALLAKSSLIISGRSYIFELANLLHKKSLGIFNSEDIVTYCKSTTLSNGIAVPDNPENIDSQNIVKRVGELVG